MMSSKRALMAAIAAVSLGSLPLVAQSPAAKPAPPSQPSAASARQAYKVPRTSEGAPDLTGNWTFATYTPLERPAQFAGKEFFTPEEAAAFVKSRDENLNAQASDDIHY